MEIESELRSLYVKLMVLSAEWKAEEEGTWPGDTQYNGADEEGRAMDMIGRSIAYADSAKLVRGLLLRVRQDGF